MCKLTNKNRQSGAALLVVLGIVMAITILSLGFLSRSDVELACGTNMTLKAQMDYLAESALEHAKGLILNPQEITGAYWTGATRQQIVSGSDYYDVSVEQYGECNYRIECEAYREKAGERIGSSKLKAELRIDPFIAIRTGDQWTVEPLTTINGDVYCGGELLGNGYIAGDAYARNSISMDPNRIEGQKYENSDELVSWPGLSVFNFVPTYYDQTGSYPAQNLDPNVFFDCVFGSALSEPPEVFYRNGNIELAGGVTINGMLVVNGDLIISDANSSAVNRIVAGKNFPALLVNGELIVRGGGRLTVEGLVQVREKIRGDFAAGANVTVLGSLFIELWNIEGMDSNGNSVNLTASPNKAAVMVWDWLGLSRRWSPAAGAFYRSIERL